ncbi:hypothetical protein UlMin_018108 [Ulmus minor]
MVLIKSIALSLPVYTMQSMKLPKSFCAKLDAIIRNFWWSASSSNNSLCLKAWSDVCQPKQWGGLGFRRMHDLNFSLLAKWAWSILQGKNSFCCSILRTRYLLHNKLLYATPSKGDSPFWKAIMVTKDLISSGACFLVGNDDNFSAKSTYLSANSSKFKEVPEILKSYWNKLWCCKTILPRHKILWCQMLSNCLPIRERLASCFPIPDLNCPFCHSNIENILHLASPMHFLRFLWDLEAQDSRVAKGYAGQSILLFASILCDLLWKHGNDITHGGAPMDPALLFQNINRSYLSILKNLTIPPPAISHS